MNITKHTQQKLQHWNSNKPIKLIEIKLTVNE